MSWAGTFPMPLWFVDAGRNIQTERRGASVLVTFFSSFIIGPAAVRRKAGKRDDSRMTKMVKDSADWIPPPPSLWREKKRGWFVQCGTITNFGKKRAVETQNEDGSFRPDLWESRTKKKQKKIIKRMGIGFEERKASKTFASFSHDGFLLFFCNRSICNTHIFFYIEEKIFIYIRIH